MYIIQISFFIKPATATDSVIILNLIDMIEFIAANMVHLYNASWFSYNRLVMAIFAVTLRWTLFWCAIC